MPIHAITPRTPEERRIQRIIERGTREQKAAVFYGLQAQFDEMPLAEYESDACQRLVILQGQLESATHE